jgi:hypothetical protein
VLKAKSVIDFQTMAFPIIPQRQLNTDRAFRALHLIYSLDPKLHLGLVQYTPSALFGRPKGLLKSRNSLI